jgi:hypothetical protein
VIDSCCAHPRSGAFHGGSQLRLRRPDEAADQVVRTIAILYLRDPILKP